LSLSYPSTLLHTSLLDFKTIASATLHQKLD